jgi:uncharacterized membrane protein YgcG
MNVQTFYRPLALLSILSLLLASTITVASVSADSSGAYVPPGQLTRRGVSGTVAAVGSDSIVVETKFGNVTVNVDGGTIIKSKGDIIALEDIQVGDRAGVLLNKPPDAPKDKDDDDDGDDPDVTPPDTSDDTSTDPDVTPPDTSDDTSTDPDVTPPDTSDDTGTDTDTEPEDKPLAPSFRQDVTALRISIVPSKATRKHECVVVTETGDGTTTVLDEDGNETELEGDEGTEGEDVCLITQTGRGGGKKITGSTSSDTVDTRLERLAEKNAELADKLAEKKAAVQEKRDERLAKTVGNAPEDKKGKAQGAKDKNSNRGLGNSDSGSSGSSGESGSSSNGNGNSGNSGNSGSSGSSGNGNSGSSGGGKDKDKGGPPEDKGKKK